MQIPAITAYEAQAISAETSGTPRFAKSIPNTGDKAKRINPKIKYMYSLLYKRKGSQGLKPCMYVCRNYL